jgi:SSS family solute:Na+ symporter
MDYNIPMGIGVFVGLAIFLVVGFAMVRLIRGSGKRFIIAGKSLPFILVSATLLAQAMDANCSLGNAGGVYSGGFWIGYSYPLGLALCLLVVGLFFAKPLNRMNLITLPDFYYRRYDRKVEVIVSLLMSFSFLILIAGNLAGAGWILSTLLPISLIQGIGIMAAIVFVYTLAGGLFSVVSTDITQIYPAILSFFIGVIFLLTVYGGWQYFSGAIPSGYFDMSGLTSIDNGALIVWANLAALGIGDVVALDFMERMFAAKNPETAQKACWWAAGWTAAAGFACSMIGLMAFQLLPGIADYRMVLPAMAMHEVPFWIGVFMMVGVIGAGLSTADGGMLATSSVWGRNIIQRNIWQIWRKEYTAEDRARLDKRLLVITRFMGIPVMALGVLIAYLKPEPGMMLVLAFDVVFAGCLVPLTLGIYWKKANTTGALAAVIVGSILRLVLYFTIPPHLAGLDTLIPPLISLAVMVPVSLLTQKKDPPKYGVIHETPDDTQVLSTMY